VCSWVGNAMRKNHEETKQDETMVGGAERTAAHAGDMSRGERTSGVDDTGDKAC
jgi:hypothetical protein